MEDPAQNRLSRRERQIMQVLYRAGKAGVAEVLEALPDPPSYSAVRTLLRILEEKGHVRHRTEGTRYVYEPRGSREKARRSALSGVLHNLFEGSREKLLAALLDRRDADLTDEELERLALLIERERRNGR